MNWGVARILEFYAECKSSIFFRNTDNYLPHYVGNIWIFVCSSSTVQCFIWLNSHLLCDTSGTIVAVMKVPCLCDVSTDSYGLGKITRSFSQTDLRTLIEFHILLGKSDLECYKLLKKVLETPCFFMWNCLLMGECH